VTLLTAATVLLLLWPRPQLLPQHVHPLLATARVPSRTSRSSVIPLRLLSGGVSPSQLYPVHLRLGVVYEFSLPRALLPASSDIVASLVRNDGLRRIPVVSEVAANDGEWRLLLYSEEAGTYRLSIDETEGAPTPQLQEPPPCTVLPGVSPSGAARLAALFTWFQHLREHCNNSAASIAAATALGAPTLPHLTVTTRSEKFFGVVEFQEVSSSMSGGTREQRTSLYQFLAARWRSAASVGNALTLGRWVSVPSRSSAVAGAAAAVAAPELPGVSRSSANAFLRDSPTWSDCEEVYSDYAEKSRSVCEARVQNRTWQWLPWGSRRRDEWIMQSADMRQCTQRWRGHIQMHGDSLGFQLRRGMICALHTLAFGHPQQHEQQRAESRAAFVSELHPAIVHEPPMVLRFFLPDGFPYGQFLTHDDYLQLMPEHVAVSPASSQPALSALGNQSSGAAASADEMRIWLIGMWPVSYSNASAWHDGLVRLHHHMLQQGGRHLFVLVGSVRTLDIRGGHETSVRWQTPRRVRLWHDIARAVFADSPVVELLDWWRMSQTRDDERVDNCHSCPFVYYELAQIVWKHICSGNRNTTRVAE